MNGIDRIPSVQEKLGELASLAATVDDLVLSSEASPEKVAMASARTTGHADPALFRQVMGVQMAVSNAFSRPGEVRLRDMDYDLLDGEAPILHGGLGYVRCTVDAVHDGADHLIVVGAVRHCEVRQGEPLIFFRGRYVRVVDFDDYPVVSWWG